MLRIAFMGTFPASLAAPVRRHLSVPCEIAVSEEVGVITRLSEVDVLVTLALTPEIGRAATRVKLVQVPGAGLDRIDRSALPNGVVLANVYGHETGIAEYVIGAMLTLTREFTRVDAALRVGEWTSQWAVGIKPPPPWPELAGRTIGVLGYGRIGRAVAHRARAFDMNICAIRRSVHGIDKDPAVLGGPEMMDEVLQRSDYVVIAMPATRDTIGSTTRDTIGSIDRRRLDLMKSTAFLVNVSRAEIVDEDALYDALAQRSIAGAALDVWYRYPSHSGPAAPATRPFHKLPNVLMTPHVSGWTDGMLEARAELIAENIRRVAQGERPLNLVAG
jgi:phosphoglycerate dehydrogenase-like enzyme